MMERDARMEAETCGDCWTVGGSILIFIYYTPVISISSESKPSTTNRPILLAIIILDNFVGRRGEYRCVHFRIGATMRAGETE